jgi:hypothetical protein
MWVTGNATGADWVASFSFRVSGFGRGRRLGTRLGASRLPCGEAAI